MTLRLKLLVLISSVALLSATGVTTVALWRDLGQAQRLLESEGNALAASLATSAPVWLGPDGAQPGAREALTPTLNRALAAAPLVRAWVVDRQGRVVACADKTHTGCPAGAPSEFRPVGGPLLVLENLVKRNRLESSAPVVNRGELLGAVRVSYRNEVVLESARGLAWSAALIAGFWIFLGLSFGSVLLRRITRPLTQVVSAAEKVAEGEEIRIDVEADPELTELISAFNGMSARLSLGREQMRELIASLNERVARATAENLKTERLATLGAIAAGFAHEMGNSLHVIAGFTKVVLRELPDEAPHRADLLAVRRETDRAAALLERFLFFARARSAHAEAQSIEPVLREAVEVIGPAAKEARVITSITLEPGLPLVRFDAELLRQAFLNLCVNAVQAMAKQPGGELFVRALRSGRGVLVEVQDTGPGIKPEVKERIFEPFFTTKDTGTGLGLAIVRQATEASFGTVEVQSTEGEGATFRIWLPAAKDGSLASTP